MHSPGLPQTRYVAELTMSAWPSCFCLLYAEMLSPFGQVRDERARFLTREQTPQGVGLHGAEGCCGPGLFV